MYEALYGQAAELGSSRNVSFSDLIALAVLDAKALKCGQRCYRSTVPYILRVPRSFGMAIGRTDAYVLSTACSDLRARAVERP